MRCAKPIPSKALRALPAATMHLPSVREAPLQVLSRPALLLQRRGHVLIHDRHCAPRVVPQGSIGFYPAAADYGGSTWSSCNDSVYSVLELPQSICTDLLGHAPLWLATLRSPLQFSDDCVKWWIDEIVSHCAAGEPNGPLYTEVVGLALLTYLDARVGARAVSGAGRTEPLPQQAVRRMQDHIDAHIATSLSIGELAALCGCSPAHFARMFRHSFGMPVHQFVMQRRLALARAMLQADSCSLAEIAIACGFSSQAHFNSAFKRHEGGTPGDFRAARGRPRQSA